MLDGIFNDVRREDIMAEMEMTIIKEAVVVRKGDKIAQIRLMKHSTSLMGIESEVERDGGYGSTGN